MLHSRVSTEELTLVSFSVIRKIVHPQSIWSNIIFGREECCKDLGGRVENNAEIKLLLAKFKGKSPQQKNLGQVMIPENPSRLYAIHAAHQSTETSDL